jgi:hypothetical protein
MSEIPDIPEAEIRKIVAQGQQGQKVSETHPPQQISPVVVSTLAMEEA